MTQKQLDGRYTYSFPITDGTIELPAGIVPGQNLELLISRLTAPAHHIRNFSDLPRRFLCIATDIATGEVVRLDRGDLGDAVRASAALPLAFTPVPREGRLLVDGGLVRNFPVEDARALGATFVIGVDIGSTSLRTPQIRNFLQVFSQALAFSDEAERARQRSLCDLLLTPDITDLSLLDFENPHEIIRRGEEAARAVYPQLDSLARLQHTLPPVARRRLPLFTDSVRVSSITVEDDSTLTHATLLNELGIPVPSHLALTQIDDAIDRIGSLGIYQTVSYRLPGGVNSDSLLIRARGARSAFLRLGLRYDTFDEAAMLLNGTVTHLGNELATGTIDLRLGVQKALEAVYSYPISLATGIGLRSEIALKENLVPTFREQRMTSRLDVRSALADLSLGSWYSRTVLVNTGIRAEYADISPSIAEENFLIVERLVALHGMIQIDHLDRAYLPRRGVKATAGIDGTFASLSSRGSFVRWFAQLTGAAPITSRLSTSAAFFAGLGTGTGLPAHYSISLGGLRTPAMLPYDRLVRTSFAGLQQQELNGRQAQSLHLTIQYEFAPSMYLSIQGSAGRAGNENTLHVGGEHYSTGVGVTASYLSLLGPLEFTLMTGSVHHLLSYVSIGVDF
jgi:NTE family protein